ncbi:MAG: hypothetical protein ACLQOO_18895 [Terriglobia bacterium]
MGLAPYHGTEGRVRERLKHLLLVVLFQVIVSHLPGRGLSLTVVNLTLNNGYWGSSRLHAAMSNACDLIGDLVGFLFGRVPSIADMKLCTRRIAPRGYALLLDRVR